VTRTILLLSADCLWLHPREASAAQRLRSSRHVGDWQPARSARGQYQRFL